MHRAFLPAHLPGLAVVLLATAGCSLAPSPEPPAMGAPESWRSPAAATPAGAVTDDWWRAFGDPQLDALVARGLEANHDLALAISRLEESRALARLAGADRLPSVALEAAAARTRLSEESGAVAPGGDPEVDYGRVAATVAFEVDLFGRARNQAEAARQDLLAAAWSRDAVRLAVVSDIVTAYFDLAGLDRQAMVTRETVETRRRTEQLIRDRFEGGLVSRLDLERARAERAAAAAALPEIERRRRATENRLAILLGGMPGEIERGKGLEAITLPEVPAGLPSELLLRRPDIAVAEARLAAASARVGQARAALFPSIGLTGYYGRESAELLGALAAVWLRGALFGAAANDIYFQIGLITLIGLASKNAILMVEFATQRRAAGATVEGAAQEAARLRFRPIVMTSLAFVLGVLPLVVSTGAGAASRHSIGTGVFGGMIAATFIAVFFIPVFYVIITRLGEKRRGSDVEASSSGQEVSS